MPDARQLRLNYLDDVCSAIGAYLAEGLEAHIASDSPGGDVLSVRFTLAEGARYQELLREQMAKRLPPAT
ncbi:MAG: hypothetical protein M0R73_07545 [Dehalococcoidia bacterium]|nr:hypothetical protein [Dehalococcoidia bacterium]